MADMGREQIFTTLFTIGSVEKLQAFGSRYGALANAYNFYFYS